MERFKKLRFIAVSVMLTGLVFLFSSLPVFAQDYHVAWNNNFGGYGDDFYASVTVATSKADGFVAVGYSDEASFGNGDWEDVAGKGGRDAIIVNYGYGTYIQGDVLWCKNFGGNGDDAYWAVTTVSDGYVAVGYSDFDSFGNGDWEGVVGKGGQDAIIVKYDRNGDVVWKKNFGGNGQDIYFAVTTVSDGVVAVGHSASASFGNGDWAGISAKGTHDAIAVKYDHNGNVVWKKSLGGKGWDSYTWVTAVPDGVVATGYSNSVGYGDWTGISEKGGRDATIVKYDNNGNVVWKKNFGGNGADFLVSVTTVSDGVVAAGYSESGSFGNGDWTGVSGKGGDDAIIVKLDHAGNVVWKKNFGGNAVDRYAAVTALSDGYVAVGYSGAGSFNTGDWIGFMGKGGNDAIMVKYDNAGNMEWRKNFGGSGDDHYIWADQIYGGFVAMGQSSESSFGTGDWTDIEGKGGNDATIVKCDTLIITFIPVTEIINVPQKTTVGVPLTLKGTVVPGNATYQTFAWELLDAGTTGATLSGGNTLNTTGTGTAVVRAIITNGLGKGEDYEQYFDIAVNPADFVSVTDIINVPTETTVGIPLTLTGTVVPDNATNKAIVWGIKSAGTTGATLSSGNILNTIEIGTVIITATIAEGIGLGVDFVKDCIIAINPEDFVSVTDIINVPQWTTVGVPLTLTGTVIPSDATYQTIVWSVQNGGGTGATITDGNILNTTKTGTATIRAIIENGTGIGIDYIKDFKIGINPEDFVAVTDIIDVPTEATIKVPLLLTGTVIPENATYKNIGWKVIDAGGSGAYISGVNTLNITAAGSALVRAIVANGLGIGIEYTQDFSITIGVGIAEISQSNTLKAYTRNGILYVSGLTVGETWRVYDILGKLVYQGVATDETVNIPLSVSGVYIIRSGEKTAKVVND
ncbi:MAG: hypothetical protein FWG84_00180 [Bacteroidales bacterium]|nr:hypothetical protein [Bacteroidales bacterium]